MKTRLMEAKPGQYKVLTVISASTCPLKNVQHISAVSNPTVIRLINSHLTGKSFAECGTLYIVHSKAWTHGFLQGNYLGFISYYKVCYTMLFVDVNLLFLLSEKW